MSGRRRVRVDPGFFSELDAQLGDTRGPLGQPSTTDFLLVDLPSIAAKFSEDFDELPPMYPDRDDYRYLVSCQVEAVMKSAENGLVSKAAMTKA